MQRCAQSCVASCATRSAAPPSTGLPWPTATVSNRRVPSLATESMAVVMSAVLAFEMTKVWLSFTLKGANRVIREAKGR